MKDWLMISWTDRQARFLFDAIEAFHDELVAFVANEYGVTLDRSDARAVLTASLAVMPKKGRALPAQIPLEHDVVAYFASLRKMPRVDVLPSDRVPLAAHGPGALELLPQE